MNAREFERVMSELTNIVDEGIHIVAQNGISLFYNQAMATLEKTRREDVIGKPFREVFSYIPKEESTLRRALKFGTSTKNTQQTYLNSYGKEVTTINSTVPVIDDNGRVLAAIEVAKDITEIKSMSNTILDLQSEALPLRKAKKIPEINKYRFLDIIGENKDFKEMIFRANRAAKSDASVFICGETGTGKELVAQSIHFESERREQPFLAQNCAALPETLLESILFGTAKGGFTGAVDRAGLFEQANGGTLLLDEISAMPYDLQSKLLRVLQEDYIRRVGGTKDIPIDVRIIATVNEPAEHLMEAGKLRRDLYYRLNVVKIEIPPLRDRKDDIPILVERFLEKHNQRFGKEIWMASERALEMLTEYEYPGNVRELENIIMSAISLADKEHVLTEKLLQMPRYATPREEHSLKYDSAKMSIDEFLANTELEIIKDALKKNRGNVSRAAQFLGIKRQTLQHKLKKYAL